MSINPNETLIVGSWVMAGGRMIADSEVQHIRTLVADELERVAIAPSGWESLYKNPRDGRYWEMFFPHSEMHGGDPEALRVVDLRSVQEKYGISDGSAAQR